MKSGNETFVCTICDANYSEEAGGCEGELGIIEVAFCPFCLEGVVQMVEQLKAEGLA